MEDKYKKILGIFAVVAILFIAWIVYINFFTGGGGGGCSQVCIDGICYDCGDGICEAGENATTCLVDCHPDFIEPPIC